MNHWVVGWVDWNLVLDESGGPNWAGNVVDAAVIVNKTSDEFYKQPMFYAIGHFSKFVPRGSRRVSLTGGNRSVKAIAFHTPQDLIVIVFLNKYTMPGQDQERIQYFLFLQEKCGSSHQCRRSSPWYCQFRSSCQVYRYIYLPGQKSAALQINWWINLSISFKN